MVIIAATLNMLSSFIVVMESLGLQIVFELSREQLKCQSEMIPSAIVKTLLTNAQFLIMPWKNGLGTTAEIAIFPREASLAAANFEWRLSQATIQGSNIFSKFAGYSRLLFVVSGEGLVLNEVPLRPGHAHKFEGEESIACELIQGPVLDFGIIYRRDLYRCQADCLAIKEPMTLKLSDGTHFLRALGGDVRIDGTSIANDDVLLIEGAAILMIDAKPTGVQLIRLSLDQI